MKKFLKNNVYIIILSYKIILNLIKKLVISMNTGISFSYIIYIVNINTAIVP